MAGSSIVKSAQLRSAVSDINKYKTAINAFKLQYNALPGDMTNASSYWGTNCDATPTNCNGNGNKLITASGTAVTQEIYRFWQILNLSEILPEKFTGIGIGTGVGADIGSNVPATAIPKAGIGIRAAGLSWYLYTTGRNYLPVKNFFHLGGTTTDAPIHIDIISPIDAYNVDLKLDDGLPGQGKIFGIWATNCTGSGSQDTDTAAYNISSSIATCTLLFDSN